MKGKTVVITILIIAIIIGGALVFNQYSQNNNKLDYYTLVNELIPMGRVQKIYFDGYYNVRVMLAEGETAVKNPNSFPLSYDYAVAVPSREKFHEDFSAAKAKQDALIESGVLTGNFVHYNEISVVYSNPSGVNIADIIFYLVLMALTIGAIVYVMRTISRQNNQGMMFARSKARVNENVKVRFSDVAGCDEEKEEMAEIIDFLKNPKHYTEVGARVPHGVLLVGPPGTGKTLLAKAVAGEAGVPFFSISGSDFVEMYVGVGAARVRDLFDQAKRNMPCIVFVDEIDAVGRQRGAGLGGGNDEREQTLNQLLVQMDGFESNSGIIVMAATNRSDVLDPALMRPGRFDRQIYVDYPDVRGREAILKMHSRNKPLGPNVNLKKIAKITMGFTGADLENILNEAAIIAARNGRTVITMEDINEGLNKISMGPAKKSRLVTEADKRIVAYHEAGHAIVSKVCDTLTVHGVTIVPRGRAGGFTSYMPKNDNTFSSKQQMFDQITMALGGRAAEEIILASITQGASGDIKQLTRIAHEMVTSYGMSDAIGPIYYGSDGEVFVGRSYQSKNSYSEEVAALIDKEEQKLIKDAHNRARKILDEHIDILHNFAKILLECETIDEEDVDAIMNNADPETVIANVKKREQDIENLRKQAQEVKEAEEKQKKEENHKETK